eukprot:6659672-Pyramimonas_sp.AAC.1
MYTYVYLLWGVESTLAVIGTGGPGCHKSVVWGTRRARARHHRFFKRPVHRIPCQHAGCCSCG